MAWREQLREQSIELEYHNILAQVDAAQMLDLVGERVFTAKELSATLD
jgi:hypothetical protein